MKAWVLEDINKLNFKEDIDELSLSDGMALIKVKASGICGSDIPRVYQDGAHKMPIILGHEFSGEVVKLGEKVNDKWLGKRVGVFPLIPCKRCKACLSKNYEMCAQYSYLGSRINGGFAEYVAVPEWNLIEIPTSVSFEQAAMLEPMAVAVHAIRRLNICECMNVAVYGLGTIGQLIIMFLLERGIKKIYAIGSKDAQLKMVNEMGVPVSNCCNSNNVDVKEWIYKKTDQQGAEVIFECVGKSETIVQSIDCLKFAGQGCMVGNPGSDITFDKNLYWKILRRQLRLTGTWNSSYLGEGDEDSKTDDWNYVLGCLKEKRIKPETLITHKFDLREISKGFEIMRNKNVDYMKVMMIDDRNINNKGS